MIPTFWYVNDVIGTMLPPMVCDVLKEVVGIGMRWPMRISAFSPSVTRSCGLASVRLSESLLRKLIRTPGIAPIVQFPCCRSEVRLLSGSEAAPPRNERVRFFALRSSPRVWASVRSISSS